MKVILNSSIPWPDCLLDVSKILYVQPEKNCSLACPWMGYFEHTLHCGQVVHLPFYFAVGIQFRLEIGVSANFSCFFLLLSLENSNLSLNQTGFVLWPDLDFFAGISLSVFSEICLLTL